jgi:hypothetical protein
MADLTPAEVTNLDRYGDPALEWTRVRDALASGPIGGEFFLGTVRPDGRPHAAGVGALCLDDVLYFVSGPTTRKSRNVAANPACTLSAKFPGIDVIIEGSAARVTDPATLEKIAAHYRDNAGWPAEVEGDAFTAPFSAPSAGPPPWYLYTITLHTVFAVATAEPTGATRWRFTH